MFGAREASWALIRRDLGLQYVQIGLILGVPTMVSSLVEPFIGVLGDTGRRRKLIVGGGIAFAAALLIFAVSPSFLLLLLASSLLYPASGSFVSLSQATLMDADTSQRQQNMARWTAAGALGAVAGPLLLAGLLTQHLGWRPLFVALAAITLPVVALAAFQLNNHHAPEEGESLVEGLRSALGYLRCGRVLRWLTLLECSDLLLDVLLGYLALYFGDVVGATASEAALAVTVWTCAGLAGNLLLLPVLARIDGLRYVRTSAVAALVVFPAMLLVPGFLPKVLLIGALALTNAGWYPVLKAGLYAELPERSGTALAVSTIFSTGAALLPFMVGLVAQRAGLEIALALLMAGPIVLLLGVPRTARSVRRRTNQDAGARRESPHV